MKIDLIRTERHLLKEMGFICHVEHPHKFIISYLKVLAAPSELMQVAWNLANDRYVHSLITLILVVTFIPTFVWHGWYIATPCVVCTLFSSLNLLTAYSVLMVLMVKD